MLHHIFHSDGWYNITTKNAHDPCPPGGGRCQQGTEKMAMEAYQKTVSGHWLMDLTLLHHHTQPPVLFRDMGLTGIVVVLLGKVFFALKLI